MDKVIEGYRLEGYVKQNYGCMDLHSKPEEQKKELQSFIRECEDHLNANSSRTYTSVQLQIVPEYRQDDNKEREELVSKLAEYFGFNWKDGTYTYNLTRVKEAFDYGTMSLDDFQEMNDDDLYELADFILGFMKFR
ncbi:hypothetical protein EDM57_04645 [Brevibacillus gelatini]|uniref:Uncharacterized protein n=1 Tax=Brevibacillus gelatini TaxID=1655277 RepID=A0A3M8B9D4_9BACL|nr:hypothetical protein [Brevibacillus gelatini]RNB59435.1 hypothetical protein EDM57_04645 [Brevibacillus gelatini]